MKRDLPDAKKSVAYPSSSWYPPRALRLVQASARDGSLRYVSKGNCLHGFSTADGGGWERIAEAAHLKRPLSLISVDNSVKIMYNSVQFSAAHQPHASIIFSLQARSNIVAPHLADSNTMVFGDSESVWLCPQLAVSLA